MEQINKYQNGKIYKIINDNLPNLVYYGATIRPLKKRFSEHKSNVNTCCSKLLFTCGEPKIILIENYPCNNKRELEMREREYIKGNRCMNLNIPCQTLWEYKDNIKRKKKEKEKEYYENYKKYIKEFLEKYEVLEEYKNYDNKSGFIKISDIHKTIKDFDYYKKLSKIEKRNFTIKYLVETIKCNINLRYYYKERYRNTKENIDLRHVLVYHLRNYK